MLYKAIIINSKKPIDPTDMYVQGQKIILTPEQRDAAQKQPKKNISTNNPITKNKQIIETDKKNEQFIFSEGFGNYLKYLVKTGRYSPYNLHALMPDFILPKNLQSDKLPFFSRVKGEYEEKSDEYKKERKANNAEKNPTTKDDFLAGWDKTKAIASTVAWKNLIKPAGKAGLKKVGSSAASMAKSMKMDGPIKGIFKKMGIDIEDVKEEGQIFIDKHDGSVDLNGHFFRCRGSKGAQDFLVFMTIGIGGKAAMTILGLGAAGAMIANPLTAPIGCILMAMGMKKAFETLAIDSPMKLASIIISLAQGIKDKNTKVKIVDENGRITEEGYKAIENEIRDELPGLVNNISNLGGLPGLATQSNSSEFDEAMYGEIYDVVHQNKEILTSIEQEENQSMNGSDMPFDEEEMTKRLNILRGITAVNSNEDVNQTNFAERFDSNSTKLNYYGGKGTDPNQKQTFGPNKKPHSSSLSS